MKRLLSRSTFSGLKRLLGRNEAFVVKVGSDGGGFMDRNEATNGSSA